MFGLMRKLISKPFADTPEKCDHLGSLVSDMVNDPEFVSKPRLPSNKKFDDNVATLVDIAPLPKIIEGKLDYGDWYPRNGVDGLLIVKAAKPVWRIINEDFDSTDAEMVLFDDRTVSPVSESGVYYSGLKPIAYRRKGVLFRKNKCPICTDGMLISRSTKSSIDSGSIDDGWVHTFEGMCPHCKGKGYTLERFKR